MVYYATYGMYVFYTMYRTVLHYGGADAKVIERMNACTTSSIAGRRRVRAAAVGWKCFMLHTGTTKHYTYDMIHTTCLMIKCARYDHERGVRHPRYHTTSNCTTAVIEAHFDSTPPATAWRLSPGACNRISTIVAAFDLLLPSCQHRRNGFTRHVIHSGDDSSSSSSAPPLRRNSHHIWTFSPNSFGTGVITLGNPQLVLGLLPFSADGKQIEGHDGFNVSRQRDGGGDRNYGGGREGKKSDGGRGDLDNNTVRGVYDVLPSSPLSGCSTAAGRYWCLVYQQQ